MRFVLKAISVLPFGVALLTAGKGSPAMVALTADPQPRPSWVEEGRSSMNASRVGLGARFGFGQWLWGVSGLMGVILGVKRGDDDTFREGGKESAWRQVLCHTE